MKNRLSALLCAVAACLVSMAQDRPAFVNLSVNTIELPVTADSARWRSVANQIVNARDNGEQVDIIHIGDSHIQAEMGTTKLREILQEKYGNGGRGLITAFKMAGTNQPVDYVIYGKEPSQKQVRLLKRPWEITPGFTGIASSVDVPNTVIYKNLKPGHSFNRAIIFTSEGSKRQQWTNLMDSAQFETIPNEKVYGVYTSNTNSPGIIYSTIGNNGACYSDYLLIEGFADSVALLNPKLIVLSMGTNEGFSSMSEKEIESSTRQLICDLKKSNPNAVMMLWTPMECHKKGEDDVFHVVDKVKVAKDIMLDVARQEGLAIWDFYEVAGGDGVAGQWVDAGLMNPRDHVHLLAKGYRLQGELAAEALISFFRSLSPASGVNSNSY